MGEEFSCWSGSGCLYRFDHSGTAATTAAEICDALHYKEICELSVLPFAAQERRAKQ
jgi:hypothetical protein